MQTRSRDTFESINANRLTLSVVADKPLNTAGKPVIVVLAAAHQLFTWITDYASRQSSLHVLSYIRMKVHINIYGIVIAIAICYLKHVYYFSMFIYFYLFYLKHYFI